MGIMKPLKDFSSRSIRVLFTDIDGTLTDDGRLPSRSYERLERMSASGIAIVPVTGRPAGWCELIARLWPVHGVVGENGAFYFRHTESRMRRHFVIKPTERKEDRKKLKEIWSEIRKKVPGAGLASDQFSRLFDLAVDFCEDVPPLKKSDIEKIKSIFEKHGAIAKVSNIHVNGWFGDYDKVSTCRIYGRQELGFTDSQLKTNCAFAGDSPNDEPMFAYFPNSFAVSNIKKFLDQLTSPPAFVAEKPEADGFCQIADRLLTLQRG